MRRLDVRSERGQSLLMFLVTLPVLLGFAALVIDGASAFGAKRNAQNLADATALAAAQSILGPAGTCPTGPPLIDSVKTAAECYSRLNGGPSTLHECDYSDPANPERPAPGTGCYTWPYKGDSNRIEVRSTKRIDGFLVNAIGLGSIFGNGAFARAVASVATEPHCFIGGVQRDDLLPGCKLPDEPGTAVPGDHSDHCYFGDPPEQRDDLLPDCQLPDQPGTIVHADGEDHCYAGDPPVQRDDLLPDCIVPGETGNVQAATLPHCSFSGSPPVPDPDQYLNTDPLCYAVLGGTGAVGFFKSTNCPAITYSGSGQGEIGALITNGGLKASGSSNKLIKYLQLGRRDTAGCFDNTAPVSIGQPGCTQVTCAAGPRAPLDWPLPPPPYPTLRSQCPVSGNPGLSGGVQYMNTNVIRRARSGGVATLTTAVPHNIVVGQTVTVAGIGQSFNGTVTVTAVSSATKFSYNTSGGVVNDEPTTGTVSFGSLLIEPGWQNSHPSGIYCVLGDNVAGTTLTLQDKGTVLDLTGGAGYSFYAANISVVGGRFKCYQLCDPQPSGNYPILFYASGDISFSGNGPAITGYIFAPNGEIAFTGGGVNGGDGFMEAQTLKIAGNFASYYGRGPIVGGEPRQGQYIPPQGAHCFIGSPPVQRDDLLPSCSILAQPGTIVPGDHATHCYIGDPPEERDDLLPGCSLPGETGTVIHGDGEDHCYIGDPPAQRDDLLPGCVLLGEQGNVVGTPGPISMDE